MKLGIDFGTTTSTVGRLRLDGSRTIREPIPSIAAWSNGHITFGEDARTLLRSGRTDVYPIRDLKLLLGTTERIAIGQGSVDPETVATELFRHLISKIGVSDIEATTIGTPVNVPLEQRRATRRAAEKAGLGEITFVYEPTAALIGAQRFRASNNTGLTLVVDWGGGTLDIAAIRMDGARYEEVTVGGDVKDLGGSKIDAAITSRLLEQDHDLRSRVAAVPGGIQRLKDEIEEMKLDILTSIEGPDGSPEEISPLWLPRTVIRLDRALVYEILFLFAERAARAITDKLQAAGIDPREVTDVLFAGGVSQAPEIQARVMRELPNARQRTKVEGTTDALRSQELTGAGCVEITARTLFPELSRGLGIRQSDGSVCVLLPSRFPIGINTFRSAEFLVTDPEAYEAVVDLGLINTTPGSVSMSAVSDSFESLQQIFVSSGVQPPRTREPEPEKLVIRIGIDRDLAVTMSASTEMARSSIKITQSGIPLILRFEQ
jgi:hypothetical protein